MRSRIRSAEEALAAGDPARAVALAGEALAAGEPARAALDTTARALAAVARRAGLLGRHGWGPGPHPADRLARGPAGSGLRRLVHDLQHTLWSLAAAGDRAARRGVFELAETVSARSVARRDPRPPPSSGIVVSVLCCERPERLEHTLASLAASDLPAADLVFLDDASRDPRVRGLLDRFDPGAHRVHVIENRGFPTRCWPANQNAVLDYAASSRGAFSWFVTCDSDVVVAADWWSAIEAVAHALEGVTLPEGRLGVVTAFHCEASHPALYTAQRGGVGFRVKQSAGGCQLAVPGSVYRDLLGPFDEFSDWGWCERLRCAGRFIAATVPSRADHEGEQSLLFHSQVDRAEDFVG